jgi:outer membrane protein W
MQKMLIGILILYIISVTAAAFAEDLTGRFNVGIIGGGIFPSDADIDETYYVGGNFAYGINNYLAVGAEAGYTNWENKEGGTDYGDVNAVPLFADLYLRYPLEIDINTFVPYVIGATGVVFWDYDESSLLTNNGISVNMDAKLGLKVGAGIDFFVDNNFAINIEGDYVWSDADVSIAAVGTVAAATVDTDYWIVNGGLKYYFD